MTRILLLTLLLLPIKLGAQKLSILIGNDYYPISRLQTQTEVKPGWDVVSFHIGGRTLRYLDGSHATQQCDERRPTLILTPAKNEQLADYAFIRLRNKRHYRLFPSPTWHECHPISISLSTCHIQAEGDGYRIQPIAQLPAGDYVLMNIQQQAVNEWGDAMVYPIYIK